MTVLETFRRNPQALPARKLLFQIHLWLGIGIGAYMFVMGVTGAAIVFLEALERRTWPNLYSADPAGSPPVPITAVIENLQRAYPGHRVASVFAPTHGRPIYTAYVERDRQTRTVLLSSSGHVRGERPRDGVLRWVQDLHVNLLAGTAGRAANGFGGLLLLVLCITGCTIWWPGSSRWRRSTRIDVRRNWKRITWELHSAIGFWTVLMLAMWGATGIYFAFPRYVQRAVNLALPLTPNAAAPRSDPGSIPRQRADLGGILQAASAHVPGGHVAGIELPRSDDGTIVVQMSRVEPDHLDDASDVRLTFDQFSGALLLIRDGADRTAGDALLSWVKPLHFGNFGGNGVRVLWVVLGVAPAILFASGGVMWWNRVLRRRPVGAAARQARQPERVPSGRLTSPPPRPQGDH